jgi:hypothetical protein
MAPAKIPASAEGVSTGAGAVEGFVKVVLEFVIREFSCLITAPDQVFAGFRLGIESIDEGSQATADAIAHDCIADLPTDRVGHGDRLVVRGPNNEADSK